MLAVISGTVLLAACGGGGSGASSTTARATSDAEKAELAFLTEMVPHHAQAVEMARLCSDRAGHSELKGLSRSIVTAQEKEIADMKSWAKAWYGVDLMETMGGGGHGGGGMQPGADITMLRGLSGNDFDRRFLEMMTAHHTGAIESATGIRDAAPHAEVKTLAANIVTSQRAEIDQMKQWKEVWFN